jgi:hypothetical protein
MSLMVIDYLYTSLIQAASSNTLITSAHTPVGAETKFATLVNVPSKYPLERNTPVFPSSTCGSKLSLPHQQMTIELRNLPIIKLVPPPERKIANQDPPSSPASVKIPLNLYLKFTLIEMLIYVTLKLKLVLITSSVAAILLLPNASVNSLVSLA